MRRTELECTRVFHQDKAETVKVAGFWDTITFRWLQTHSTTRTYFTDIHRAILLCIILYYIFVGWQSVEMLFGSFYYLFDLFLSFIFMV